MGDSSAEFETLLDLTKDLRLAVRPNLISLVDDLLSERLISSENESELCNPSKSEVERSSRLVQLIRNKVQQNSVNYHTFIKVLRGQQDLYADILCKLECSLNDNTIKQKGNY